MSILMKRLEYANSVIAKYGRKGMHWGERKGELSNTMSQMANGHRVAAQNLLESDRLFHSFASKQLPSFESSYRNVIDSHMGISDAYEHATHAIRGSDSAEEAIGKIKGMKVNMQETHDSSIAPEKKKAYKHIMERILNRLETHD